MKAGRLYKIELYRFFHSFLFIIGMVAAFMVMLFLASDNSDALLSDGTPEGIVNSTMKVANLLIVLIVSVVISGYVGREFRQKTIHYEVMRGYRLWKISLTKTITCGILIPMILVICILIFIRAVSDVLQVYSFIHIVFMFFVLCHICSCTTLYVMLCRNGATGGCLAFVRFTLLEVVVLFATELCASTDVYYRCKALSVMSQWSVVNNTDMGIPQEYMIGILAGAILEYVVLLVAIQVCSKKKDL